MRQSTELQLICLLETSTFGGRCITALPQLPKLETRVRLPSPAPIKLVEHYDVTCDLTGLQLRKTVVNGMQLHVARDHVVEMQFSR